MHCFLKAPRSTFTLGLFGFDLTKLKEYDDGFNTHPLDRKRVHKTFIN